VASGKGQGENAKATFPNVAFKPDGRLFQVENPKATLANVACKPDCFEFDSEPQFDKMFCEIQGDVNCVPSRCQQRELAFGKLFL